MNPYKISLLILRTDTGAVIKSVEYQADALHTYTLLHAASPLVAHLFAADHGLKPNGTTSDHHKEAHP